MARCQCTCGWVVFANVDVELNCPQCDLTIVCLGSQPTVLGLGDHLARLLAIIGGNQFKRLYRRLFRRDCGCDRRQQWLNRIPIFWHRR